MNKDCTDVWSLRHRFMMESVIRSERWEDSMRCLIEWGKFWWQSPPREPGCKWGGDGYLCRWRVAVRASTWAAEGDESHRPVLVQNSWGQSASNGSEEKASHRKQRRKGGAYALKRKTRGAERWKRQPVMRSIFNEAANRGSPMQRTGLTKAWCSDKRDDPGDAEPWCTYAPCQSLFPFYPATQIFGPFLSFCSSYRFLSAPKGDDLI